MTATNIRQYILLLPALFLLMTGCAVMKVDVDVYKGPLANHEDVQTERMAAMAIGAKPLLLDLRNKLLSNKPLPTESLSTEPSVNEPLSNEPLPDKCFNNLNKLSPDEKEKSGFINVTTLIKYGCQPSPSALRVNAILSLYENRPTEELEILFAELRGASDRLDEAYKNYRDSQSQIPNYIGRWQKLPKGSALYADNGDCKTPEALNAHPLVKDADDTAKQTIKDNLEKLCKGYKNYFAVSSTEPPNKWPWKKEIPEAHEALLAIKMKPNAISPVKGLDDAFEKYGDAHQVAEGATTSYYALAKRNLVEAHSKLFFPEPENAAKRKEFADGVTRIASGFNDSVAQTNTIMRLALKALIGIDSDKNHLTDIQLMSAIEIVTATISKKRLWFIIALAEKKPEIFSDKYHLQSIITLKDGLIQEDRKIPSKKKVLQSLKTVLQKKPAETAASLLMADNFFKEDDSLKDKDNIKLFPDDKAALDGHYILKSERRYGLTATAAEKDSENNGFDPQEIAKYEKDFTAGLSGFEGGRLNKGLVQLIDDYLAASNDPDCRCKPENCPEQDKLVGELVRFSEKVLFIANYSKLVEDEHTGKGGNNGELVKQYTQILQAVGNSILNQADEFYHRKSYGKQIADPNKIEALALKSASLQDPLVFFSHVINDLQTQSDSASATYGTTTEKVAKAIADQEATKKLFNEAVADVIKPKTDYDEANRVLEEKKAELQLHLDTEAVLTETTASGNINETPFKTLLDSIIKAHDTIKLPELKSAIVTKIKQEHDITKDEARKSRLKNACDLFQKLSSYGALVIDKPIDPVAQYKSLKELFDQKRASVKSEVEAQDAVTKAKKTVLDEKVAKKEAAAKILEAATANVTKLNGEFAPLQGKKTTASNTLNKLGEAWTIVAAQLRLTDRKSIEEVKGMLRTELMKNPDQASNNDAISALNKIVTPASPITYAADSAKDSKEVLDLLIATLTHNHIEAVRLYGSANTMSVNYGEALETARRYRSQMVYIRPSSAYLKSSYPSTSLQDDANLQWENMLSKHSNRSFFGYYPSSDDLARNRIVGDIDKQFWQNINSVRVAGGGNTNYVLAKDDIGNWYVKAYSADPQPIIDSASKLAMFNMGTAMKSDILDRFTSTNKTEKATANSQKTVLEKIFDKHQTRYKESTAKTYDAMIKDRDGDTLTTDINNSWNSNEDTAKLVETLKPVLNSSGVSLKETLTKTLTGDPKKSDEQGVEITTAFGDIRRFHNTLSRAIYNLKLTKAPTEAVTIAKKDKENAEAALAKARQELEEKETDQKNKKTLLKTWEDTYAEKAAVNSAAKDTGLDHIKTERDAAQKAVDEANVEVTAAIENVTAAKADMDTKVESYNKADKNLESAEKGMTFALSETTRITRDMLAKLMQQRKTAVDDYMKSIIFIGEANNDK